MKIAEYQQMMDYLTGPRERFSNGGRTGFKNGSKGSNQFTGPGKLRKDIINAYKTLNKGQTTKTEDVYNYLKKKKNNKKERALIKKKKT